jgi:integrase
MARGEWVDPQRAKVQLRDYADRWITERANLRPRTVELYRWLLKRHVEPHLGGAMLGDIDAPLVREWRAKLLSEGVSSSTTAKAYRLLRAVLMTAVNEDRILARNPCRLPGADQEHPPERPVLTLGQVMQLADAVPRRYRALILVTTFASLRYGEAIALQSGDVDLLHGTVRVKHAFIEVRGKGMSLAPPKSRAGLRTVAIPGFVQEALREHMEAFVPHEPLRLLFTGPKGAPIRRGNFNNLVAWSKLLSEFGIEGLHFHDLRHTGNVFAAGSGVSTRDLMARMGHDSMAAALIYQHASTQADQAIAASMNARFEALQADAGRESQKPAERDSSKRSRQSQWPADGPRRLRRAIERRPGLEL